MILDSETYSSGHLIFDSLIHPAGSKRYIRLNLNIRGERKITGSVGLHSKIQIISHFLAISIINYLNFKFSYFITFGTKKKKKSSHILETFYEKMIKQLILLIVFYIFR